MDKKWLAGSGWWLVGSSDWWLVIGEVLLTTTHQLPIT